MTVSQIDIVYKKIGERLEEIRSHLKMSRADFSNSLGLSVSYYGQMAIGAKKITVNAILKLLEVTPDLNLKWLLTGNELMFGSNEHDELDKKINRLEIEVALLKDLLKEKK